MAAKLREALPSPALTVTVGDFEQIDVGEDRFDAVFSATAYHWISQKAQVDKPASILTPGGVIAIVDLTRWPRPTIRGSSLRHSPSSIDTARGTRAAGSRAQRGRPSDPPRAERRPAVRGR